jgi:hypothetical protein
VKITFNKWGGSAPRLDPKRTPNGFAVIANNTRPDPYSLKAWNQPASVGVTVRPSTKTIHRYTKDHWFQFDYDASVVPAPIINDPNHEVIFTTPTEVRYTRNSLATSSAPYPGTSYKLGIPQPDKPTVSGGVLVSESDLGITVEDVAYVITFVDEFGREGAASRPSRTISVRSTDLAGGAAENTRPPTDAEKKAHREKFDHEYAAWNALHWRVKRTTPAPTFTELPDVHVKGSSGDNRVPVIIERPAIPTGNYRFGTGAKWRIYRANTTSLGAGTFQYLTELPIATTRYTDTTPGDMLLEALSTADWYPPPDNDTKLWPSGPLKGLISVANSYLAGFTGRTLCFSIPNIPHAWPPAYQIVLEYDIVGLASVGSDIAVLTTGHPYLVSGSSPGNLTAMKLPDPQACISAQSIVALEDGVLYASPDGICAIKGYRAQVVSTQVFDERSWAAIKPHTLRAAYYEGAYIAATDSKTFIFIPGAEEAQYREISIRPKAMVTDLSTDTLYYHEGDGVLRAFNKGSGKTRYEWVSGKNDTLRPVNFGWGRVYSSDYPVTFTVSSTYNNGAQIEKSYTAASAKPFRLAGGYTATEFSISITGDKTVHEISLSTSLHELEPA